MEVALSIDWSTQRLLVIAPHPDDEAIGCGGLISRIKREGGRVFVLWGTVADVQDYSSAGLSTGSQRRQEMSEVERFWDLDGCYLALPDSRYNLHLDTTARAQLVDAIERDDHPLSLSAVQPTAIACPDPASYNQDHAALGAAAVTALRPGPDTYRTQPALVLTYEQVGDPWTAGSLQPAGNFFVELTPTDLDRKITGLRTHASQWREHPHTRSEEALRALAVLRGAQCGYALAEAYHCLRWRC